MRSWRNWALAGSALAWIAWTSWRWREFLQTVPVRSTPSPVYPSDSFWSASRQRVIVYGMKYVRNGNWGDPHPVGPVVEVDPRTGESRTLIQCDRADLSNDPEFQAILQEAPRSPRRPFRNDGPASPRLRFAIRHSTETGFMSLISSLPKGLQPIAARAANFLNLASPVRLPLELYEPVTRRRICVIAGSEQMTGGGFAEDESGFVLMGGPAIRWYLLPPQLDRVGLAKRAFLPPTFVILLLAAICRLQRALERRPTTGSPAGCPPAFPGSPHSESVARDR
jgi:hypothetical protein